MLLEIGRVGRPHGLRGEITLKLTTNRVERLDQGSALVVGDETFVVRSSRPHKAGHIVVLDGVRSRESAAQLSGQVVLAEPITDEAAIWAHEAIGSVVVDQTGSERGRVEALQENPASDLLVLEDGSLVPVTFVTRPPSGGRIEIDAPEGLFDL